MTSHMFHTKYKQNYQLKSHPVKSISSVTSRCARATHLTETTTPRDRCANLTWSSVQRHCFCWPSNHEWSGGQQNVSSPLTCNDWIVWGVSWPRGSVLDLLPPGLEFQILCQEGSVIPLISFIPLISPLQGRVLLAQFSLHVREGGLKPLTFHLISVAGHFVLARYGFKPGLSLTLTARGSTLVVRFWRLKSIPAWRLKSIPALYSMIIFLMAVT